MSEGESAPVDSCRWYARCDAAACPCQRGEMPATVDDALDHYWRLQGAFEASMSSAGTVRQMALWPAAASA